MDKYHEILKKYWGYSSFRPLQLEIIKSVVEHGQDTLGLLPTGGGKSIIFQVATLSMPEHRQMSIVVTPLIALMRDQVENLRKHKIPAVAIHSGMSREEIELELNRCVDGYYNFLYISPERLTTRGLQFRLPNMPIGLITVDEAHCISQWGYDFRPSYLKIAAIRQIIPDVPVLALTASATPKVVDDIQDKLLFKDKNVFRQSFVRKNLVYIVQNTNDKLGDLLRITKKIQGTGIVYVRSRRRTEELANFLKNYGISADFYHAGIQYKVKEKKQREWKSGHTRIIVATNAFGMGIDKPDVRFVIHTDLPDSLEAYYQEAGRGGRDGKTAYAIVLYNHKDIKQLKESVDTNFPPIKTVRSVYSAVCNFLQIPIGAGIDQSYPFNLSEFISRYNIKPLIALNSLRLLQKEGYLEFTDEITEMPKIHITASRDDVYRFQVENPAFSPLIKILLRGYPGIYDHYVQINEFWLAKVFRTDIKHIQKYLKKLDELDIIEYKPFIRSNFIYMPQGRLREKDIVFSQENYKFLRDRYIDQITSVIHYVTNIDRCRSQVLAEYFGEKDSPACGRCDVCKSKQNFNSQQAQEQILELLHQSPMSFDQIFEQLSWDKNKLKVALRSLLRQEKIIFRKDRKFYLK